MRKRFHGLKKVKVRQDWSKWTLYNLSRLANIDTRNKTYFQQKWAAKSLSRAYHGEQIREGHWERMFSKRLPSVIEMNPRYMAHHDGSELAAGRGSGRDAAPRANTRNPRATPYMQMTYYPTERRLDTAVFRALFASSTRQARQFVVHGFVTVNGKKMRQPGYLLNPGDMFQVDPERVMFGTGGTAGRISTAQLRKLRSMAQDPAILSHKDWLAPSVSTPEPTNPKTKFSKPAKDSEPNEYSTSHPTDDLSVLMHHAKKLLRTEEQSSPFGLRRLRVFRMKVKNLLSKKLPTDSEDAGIHANNVDDLNAAFKALKARLLPAAIEAAAENSQGEAPQTPPGQAFELSPADETVLREALERARDSPIEDLWRPRPYMSPFAFIPRYLEVNQNICAAVYLRHPVARPGLAEVPTPFSPQVSQLAFNWYLRRR